MAGTLVFIRSFSSHRRVPVRGGGFQKGWAMNTAFDRVIDAIDVETFLLCAGEDEAKELAAALAAAMNLPNADLVFVEHNGAGARVRIRSYAHRPGDHYRWLTQPQEVGQ